MNGTSQGGNLEPQPAADAIPEPVRRGWLRDWRRAAAAWRSTSGGRPVDEDAVRQLLKVLTEQTEHPNFGWGLHMPGGGPYL